MIDYLLAVLIVLAVLFAYGWSLWAAKSPGQILYSANRSMAEERLTPLGFVPEEGSVTGRMCTFTRGEARVFVGFDARDNLFQFGFSQRDAPRVFQKFSSINGKYEQVADEVFSLPDWSMAVERDLTTAPTQGEIEAIGAGCRKSLDDFISGLKPYSNPSP